MNIQFLLLTFALLFTKKLALNPSAVLKEEQFIPEDKRVLYKVIVENGKTNDSEKQNYALDLTKSLIKTPTNIVDSEIFSLLIDLMSSKNKTIQYKSALHLTYIGTKLPETVEIIAKNGAVSHFFKLLHSSNDKIASISLWFLYDIVYEHPQLNIYYNDLELIKHLQKLINSQPEKHILDPATFILVAMCESEEFVLKEESVKELLSIILELSDHSDIEIAGDAELGLSSLVCSYNKIYPHIFDNEKAIKAFIHLLGHEIIETQQTALMILAYIINDENKQFVIDNGILNNLNDFLHHADERVVRLALRIINKLSNGNTEYISTALISLIIDHLSSQNDKIKKEAIIFLTKLSCFSNKVHVSTMITNNIIAEFCRILKKNGNESSNITNRILIGYLNILKNAGDQTCFAFYQLEKCGGIYDLHKFAKSENLKTKKLAVNVLAIFEDTNVCSTFRKPELWCQ